MVAAYTSASVMNTELLKSLKSRSTCCLNKCRSRVRCGAPGAGRRCAERLLPHISCLLALFGGAGLATCARLKWDPTAYVALRELFPLEYRAVCVALPLCCAAAVALNHLAACALPVISPRRRLLLYVYAALTLALVACEGALAGWLAARLARWLRSPQARRVLVAMDFKDYFVGPALSFLGRFIPVSRKAKALLDEADEDAPQNVYCAVGAGAALALLQLLAAAAALLAASGAPAPCPTNCGCPHIERGLLNGGSYRGSAYIDMAPLRAAPRAGRTPRPAPPAPAPVL